MRSVLLSREGDACCGAWCTWMACTGTCWATAPPMRHRDLLALCPTQPPSTLKHPHAQGLAHCFPIPTAIFPGSQRSPSCPESCLQGLYTLFLLFPSPPTQGLASALFGVLALTHQRHDLPSSQHRKVAEYLLSLWQWDGSGRSGENRAGLVRQGQNIWLKLTDKDSRGPSGEGHACQWDIRGFS